MLSKERKPSRAAVAVQYELEIRVLRALLISWEAKRTDSEQPPRGNSINRTLVTELFNDRTLVTEVYRLAGRTMIVTKASLASII